MQEELNNKEKKIYSALFEGEENEFSEKIQILQSNLSKKKSPSREFVDYQTLIKKEKQNKIINFRRNHMNKKFTILLAAAAIVLLGVFFAINQSSKGSSNQQEQAAQTAKIIFLSGEVSIKSASGEENTKPVLGTIVNQQDTIITANKSSAEVQLNNGSTIKIKSNSEFTITTIANSQGESKEEVFLKRGLIVADIKKRKQTDSFNVATPTVIAGVRGTKFQVEVNPSSSQEATVIIVENGSVGITKKNKDGSPSTTEPAEILEANQKISEKRGGNLVKSQLTPEQTRSEIEKLNDANSLGDLLKLHGKSEIEKITLEDKTIIRGIISDMNDNFFTIQTLDGTIKVDRNKIVSSETEKVK
jgi:hypothetical protein